MKFLYSLWFLFLFFCQKPIEPAGPDDVIGKTFKDLHVYVQEKLNNSVRENEQIRKSKEKVNKLLCLQILKRLSYVYHCYISLRTIKNILTI